MSQIWWCEEHLASGWGGGRARWCHLAPSTDELSDNYQCRVVLRLLVDPSDGETVLVRKQNGEWPAGVIETMRMVDDFDQHYVDADDCRRILDALAAASKEQR